LPFAGAREAACKETRRCGKGSRRCRAQIEAHDFSAGAETMSAKAMVAEREQSRACVEDTCSAWDKIAPGYDRTVTATHMWVGGEGLRHVGLRAGMRFLDVAAGSGALSIPAARLGAKVLATDQSAVMLDHLAARARREGLEIETRVMDGHALALDDSCFDIAGSQFGVMLFPDMPRGIAELVRVVKPGGRVLMTVLGDVHRVEFIGFFAAAIQAIRPAFDPPMNPPPRPFQLQDPARLRRELADAGLKDVEIATVTEVMEFASGKELWDWLVSSNPVAEAILADQAVTNEERGILSQTLDRMVRERAAGSGLAKLTNAINIGVGTK
jgi:ubiquinone/menaquinone biosynthesis C-methylase UbiE